MNLQYLPVNQEKQGRQKSNNQEYLLDHKVQLYDIFPKIRIQMFTLIFSYFIDHFSRLFFFMFYISNHVFQRFLKSINTFFHCTKLLNTAYIISTFSLVVNVLYRLLIL